MHFAISAGPACYTLLPYCTFWGCYIHFFCYVKSHLWASDYSMFFGVTKGCCTRVFIARWQHGYLCSCKYNMQMFLLMVFLFYLFIFFIFALFFFPVFSLFLCHVSAHVWFILALPLDVSWLDGFLPLSCDFVSDRLCEADWSCVSASPLSAVPLWSSDERWGAGETHPAAHWLPIWECAMGGGMLMKSSCLDTHK